MLVSDIITRVRRTVGDTDSLQVTDQDIYRWINDAMREIAADNQLLQKNATSNTIIGTAQYALPTDILKLYSITYDGQRLDISTLAEAEDSYTPTAANATPSAAYIWAGQITLTPTPDAVKSLVVSYTKQPTEVTAGTDTPEVPSQYHQRLVDYCKAQVAEMDDDMPRYQLKMDEFRTGVQNLKDHPEWENDAYPYINYVPEYEDTGYVL